MVVPGADQRVGLRDLLGQREFGVFTGAFVQSLMGDTVAAVAVTVLVFRRTGSPLLSALTWAATLLPHLVVAPLLGGLGDRFPRRRVLVGCDLVRMVLVGLLALPGLPLGVLFALVVAVGLPSPIFTATKSALAYDVLGPSRVGAGIGLLQTAGQLAQVFGAAVGGVVVALLSVSGALLLDAASFAVSALLLTACLGPHPPPVRAGGRLPVVGGFGATVEVLRADRLLRSVLAVSFLTVFAFVVPEGLAAPYAISLGRSASASGAVVAALAVGALAGGLYMTRGVGDRRRTALVRPLALAQLAVTSMVLLRPGYLATLVVLAVAGAASGLQVGMGALLGQRVPASRRTRVLALVGSSFFLVQAVGYALAGLLASRLAVSTVVGGAALVALLPVVVLCLRWPGADAPMAPDPDAAPPPDLAAGPAASDAGDAAPPETIHQQDAAGSAVAVPVPSRQGPSRRGDEDGEEEA